MTFFILLKKLEVGARFIEPVQRYTGRYRACKKCKSQMCQENRPPDTHGKGGNIC